MIDHPSPLRIILSVAIFVIFLSTEGLCRKPNQKSIILENEEDIIVFARTGSSLKVKCDYSGEFYVNNFEWKKIRDKDDFFAMLPDEVLTTSQWLDLENVGSDDEGQYSCTMNGVNGTETFFEKRGFVLKRATYNNGYQGKIKPKFQKVFTVNDSRLLVNSTLNLSCPFTSVSDTAFSWYRNDELLVERKSLIDGMGSIDNKYSLMNVKMSDAGNYTCVVLNKYGSIQHQFAVVVYDKPKSNDSNQDEYNISDDKHFVLSLLPMLSSLPMEKKLKARIAIETSLHNIAFPVLKTEEKFHIENVHTTQLPYTTLQPHTTPEPSSTPEPPTTPEPYSYYTTIPEFSSDFSDVDDTTTQWY
ncbi:hypothetical protein ACI65C_007681 [Semiaphis heraclei]